jgi:hypothetical protein
MTGIISPKRRRIKNFSPATLGSTGPRTLRLAGLLTRRFRNGKDPGAGR